MLQWCIGGMLILLIGVGGILSPLCTHTAHAAIIQIKDDAGILDGDQVRSTASQLSHPVSISTLRTFEGSKYKHTTFAGWCILWGRRKR